MLLVFICSNLKNKAVCNSYTTYIGRTEMYDLSLERKFNFLRDEGHEVCVRL